jgi:hypothetical protein
METKTATNGKAAQGAGLPKLNGEHKTTPAQNGVSAVEEKPKTEEKAEAPAAEEKPLTVEDRIKKVGTLNDLIAKRATFKNHLERVEKLKFSDYDEKDTIALTDAKGETYNIRSSVLCQKIGAMLKTEISAKIREVEAEIAF